MPSMDIVSEIDMHEIANAVSNTQKEVATRFDFRGADVQINFNEKDKTIQLSAQSDFQVEQLLPMLENQILKRRIDIQVLDVQAMQASGKKITQRVQLKNGLETDTAKKIVKLLKENGFKAQASIMGDKVRVTDKKKDTLQAVMAYLQQQSLGCPLQFNNFKD